MYPGAGTFVLIRPAQTFYERINFAKVEFRDINRIIVDSLEEIDAELECGQALVEKK